MLNGGIESLQASQDHLAHVDGVMLGRAPYQNPWLLAEVDSVLFNEPDPAKTRESVVHALLPYIIDQIAAGSRLHHISRHVLGLYQRQPGGRQFRRKLSQEAHKPGAQAETLLAAAALCTEAEKSAAERAQVQRAF